MCPSTHYLSPPVIYRVYKHVVHLEACELILLSVPSRRISGCGGDYDIRTLTSSVSLLKKKTPHQPAFRQTLFHLDHFFIVPLGILPQRQPPCQPFALGKALLMAHLTVSDYSKKKAHFSILWRTHGAIVVTPSSSLLQVSEGRRAAEPSGGKYGL